MANYWEILRFGTVVMGLLATHAEVREILHWYESIGYEDMDARQVDLITNRTIRHANLALAA